MGYHRREKLRPEDRLSLKTLQMINICFSRIYHRIELLTPLRLPETGSAIVVCNHTSGLDPLLIQSVSRRLIVWMMAKEYYEIPALRPILKMIEAIPVDRGKRESASTRSALRALARGRVVGVFPEGRIEPSREILPFHTGIGLLAAKTGVPVYPAFLDGTQRGKEMGSAFACRQRASLIFGSPLHLSPKTDRSELENATRVIEQAVRALRGVRH